MHVYTYVCVQSWCSDLWYRQQFKGMTGDVEGICMGWYVKWPVTPPTSDCWSVATGPKYAPLFFDSNEISFHHIIYVAPLCDTHLNSRICTYVDPLYTPPTSGLVVCISCGSRLSSTCSGQDAPKLPVIASSSVFVTPTHVTTVEMIEEKSGNMQIPILLLPDHIHSIWRLHGFPSCWYVALYSIWWDRGCMCQRTQDTSARWAL